MVVPGEPRGCTASVAPVVPAAMVVLAFPAGLVTPVVRAATRATAVPVVAVAGWSAVVGPAVLRALAVAAVPVVLVPTR